MYLPPFEYSFNILSICLIQLNLFHSIVIFSANFNILRNSYIRLSTTTSAEKVQKTFQIFVQFSPTIWMFIKYLVFVHSADVFLFYSSNLS